MSGNIDPSQVLFIKLGGGGDKEKECIENNQTIYFGFEKLDHDLCLKDVGTAVSAAYHDENKRTVANWRSAVEKFYGADENTLWITFYNRKLWWCFTELKIEKQDDGSKIRCVKGMWSCKDINGKELSFDRLSGKLLKTQEYRGTICRVPEAQYVVRKINGLCLKESDESEKLYNSLSSTLLELIKHLSWKDFETLVDMLFSSSGWQRMGVLGKTEKTLDIEMLLPITQTKALVQIKSKSNKKEFEQYTADFEGMKETYDWMFYVVHSPNQDLIDLETDDERIKLCIMSEISRQVIDAGLTRWLIEKTS